MKRTAAIILSLALAATAHAADPARDQQDKQVLALVREIQAQQALIAQNQAKIEQRLAAVAESVRVARVFAGRGGSGR